MHAPPKIICDHSQIAQGKIPSTLFDKQFGERRYYCPFEENAINTKLSFDSFAYWSSFICIDFPKYFTHTTNCNQGKILLLLMFYGAIFPRDITMPLMETKFYVILLFYLDNPHCLLS